MCFIMWEMIFDILENAESGLILYLYVLESREET